MKPNYLSVVTLLVATLGLAGCQDDPARKDPACPIGFVDGGDGTCRQGGSCSEGYRHAGDWTCVSEEGPCPAGYVTSGKNDLCCASGYHDGGDETCVRKGICSPGYVHKGNNCEATSIETPEILELDAPAYVTAGESYTARVENPIATSTYAWAITGGTLATKSGVSVIFTAGSSGRVTLACIETNQAGRTGEVWTVSSTIVPMPVTADLDVPAYVTAGESYTVTIKNRVTTNTYAWTITGGTLESSSGDSVVFTAGSSGTVTLSCVETNRAGNTSEATATSTIVPMPVIPEIEVPGNINARESYTASVKNPVATSTYAWTIRGGTLENNSGASVVFKAGNSGTVTLSCVETNQAGTRGEAKTATRSFIPEGIDIATQVAAGGSHTCALKTDGGVSCWGLNSDGQLGDGTTTDSDAPVEVTGLSSGVAAVAAGGQHTCALTSEGVSCWGDNRLGQLGNGTKIGSATPVKVTGLSSGIVKIAAGDEHTCAIMTDGGLFCWGDNSFGQLGDGTNTSSNAPVEVTSLWGGVAAIAMGAEHTCALVTDGSVACWGDNFRGQLGDGTNTNSFIPVKVTGLTSSVAALVAGDNHTCALMTSEGVSCWGSNSAGQLGNGMTTGSAAPVKVTGLSSVVASMAAGSAHTCALMTNGGVSCWGTNVGGELGVGEITYSRTPVEVGNLSRNVAAIVANGKHTCVMMTNGGISCWGDNFFGQLGVRPSVSESLTPIEALNLSGGDVTAIAAKSDHTCALKTDGGISCWGSNYHGRLGNGMTGSLDAPVKVMGLSSGATAISVGVDHACALKTNGGVACWGSNFLGKLGDGTTTESATPVEVTGLSSTVAIAVGGNHTCALKNNGGVACWGHNMDGLGDGKTTDSKTPVSVTGLSSGVAAIAAGRDHTCALTITGRVACWGRNVDGELGDGKTTFSNVPVSVTGLSTGVAAIAAGIGHTCAVKTNGRVWCWGANSAGQLGDGTTSKSVTPVEVTGLSTGVTAIAAGINHTCALSDNGRVSCWGDNSVGQLGNGTNTSSDTPVEVVGLSSIAAITAGAGYTCALNTDGRVSCWGRNLYGQLGVLPRPSSNTPVEVTGFASTPP